jgi:hypothetical protein
MLHMATLSHGPETCAAVHAEYGALARSAADSMDAIAERHGAAIKGGWVDAPGHLWFFLVDAPNAHVVSNLMVELRFHSWNTLNISPVATVADTLNQLA